MPDDSSAGYGVSLRPQTRQFWTFQLAGWSAMALLSYVSLTIWYNPGQIAPAIHTIVQSLLGIVVSSPLRGVSRQLWQTPLVVRVALNAVAVLVASLIWTGLRLATFTWLTGETIPITDFGGWMFASVIVFAAWSVTYHALRYYRQSLEQRRLATVAQNNALRARARAQHESFKRLKAEKLFRDAQLRSLKYQLNPHFFLNALNSVSSLVSKGDKEAAMTMLARIGDFLRISLSDPDDIEHTLDDEVEALKTYLGIEEVRFGDRLRTQFIIDEGAGGTAMPSLLLQPLFENAIKHAIGQTLRPVTLTLQARRSGDRLVIIVSDDGPGLRSGVRAHETDRDGIGLNNVRQRLESAYGSDFRLELKEGQPSGVCVEMQFPASIAATGEIALDPV